MCNYNIIANCYYDDKISSICSHGFRRKKSTERKIKLTRRCVAPYRVPQLTFPLSYRIILSSLSPSPSPAIFPFDSLRTTARDHRQNFCFLSVLRGRPECVARESYFRWVTRTCTGASRKRRRGGEDVNAPSAAFPCLSPVLISLPRLYPISCSRRRQAGARPM